MNEQEQFVIRYLQSNYCTDACDQGFHDEFHSMFGGRRKFTNFGAQPVYKAQRLLASMYRRGILDRGIIGLGGHEVGFPKWVYGYTLRQG